MNIVEKARAAAAALNELADGLARGEHLQTSARPAGPPAAAPPAPTNGSAIAKFGRHKDVALSALPTPDLQWYADTLIKSVADPAKAQYRARNEVDLAAARAELSRRA